MGEDDPFDYALAIELGWSHAAVGDLPNDEFERWRAFMKWRNAMRKHQADVNAARARLG